MKRTSGIIILLCAVVLLSALWAAGASAFADDSSVVTQRLEASLINTGYNVYSGKEGYSNGAMRYLVKCDPETDELRYTVDNFIDSPAAIDITASLQNHYEGEILQYKYATVSFSQNCDVIFYAVLNKGDTENEYTDELELKVTKIDNKPPKIANLVLKENLIGTGLKYEVTITDNYSDVQLTARSGIRQITVFHYNPFVEIDLNDTTENVIESLKSAFTEVVKKNNITTSVAITESVQFTANQNGWYILFVEDWLGNNTYVPLFKYTEQPQFIVYLDFGNGYTAYNKNDLVSETQTLLQEWEGKINVDIYNNLKNTLNSFIAACQINDTQENIRKAYMALQAARTAFGEAKIVVPQPDFVNTELLDGSLRVINLDNVTSLLPGDKLELGGIITSYNGEDIKRFAYPEVLEIAGIKEPDKVIDITATLMKNDILCLPRIAMIYQVEFPADAQIVLVSTTDNAKTFAVKDILRDGNIVQFTSDVHSEEFFFVIKYANQRANKGLLIGLSAGAGGLVLLVVVMFLLVKKGVIKIGGRSAVRKDASAGDDETKEDLLEDDTLKKYRGKDIE